MPAPTANAAHCSLNVSDLANAVNFYRVLLGREPQKREPDYARFELENPALVLSLIPQQEPGVSRINHVGLRLTALDQLQAMQSRLAGAGIDHQREDNVQCCYSRQTKFWTADPDGTNWEIYVVLDDAPALGQVLPSRPFAATYAAGVQAQVWVHRLTERVPERIAAQDSSLDEVLLEGTINLKLESGSFAALLAETRRALKPGGMIRLHGLVASAPLPAVGPKLPGPAALVQRVPVEAEPMAALLRAGFINIQYSTLAQRPNFVAGSVEMREILLAAEKPDESEQTHFYPVLYRGPFASVTDDQGQTFERGKRTWVDGRAYERLQHGAQAAQFAFLKPVTREELVCATETGCC
ncbi:MAG: ArsI/CadI family heavy metal resistance metalloenzyme [Stenotrophobium sp.]